MYREASSPAAAEVAPAEFVYDAVDREEARRKGGLTMQLVAIPALVIAILGVFVSGTAGLVGGGVSAVLIYYFWKRRGLGHGAIFRVESGELAVVSQSSGKEIFRGRVSHIENVTLDKKTIQRVQEGSSAIPGMQLIASTTGPELENARLVLVGRGKRIPLTEEYLAYIDATESLGKVRVFLRKHGWVPRDEAPIDSAELEDDDPPSED